LARLVKKTNWHSRGPSRCVGVLDDFVVVDRDDRSRSLES
jgi:hypothetical protein